MVVRAAAGSAAFSSCPRIKKVSTSPELTERQHRFACGVCPISAGDADPQTGYDVRVDGNDTIIGGTSAVAPLWAGLIARINAAKASPVGFINPALYSHPGALRDITQGNNGSFAASPGWDACTGLGSPNGQKVADAV